MTKEIIKRLVIKAYKKYSTSGLVHSTVNNVAKDIMNDRRILGFRFNKANARIGWYVLELNEKDSNFNYFIFNAELAKERSLLIKKLLK
jgi:hypothetical protein